MRRNNTRALLVVSIILVASFGFVFIYIHDNPLDLVPISSINTGVIPLGSNVTIKGEITQIVVLAISPNFQDISVSDGTGSLRFFWTRTILDVGLNIIVQGTVEHNTSLRPVTNVELVGWFA